MRFCLITQNSIQLETFLALHSLPLPLPLPCPSPAPPCPGVPVIGYICGHPAASCNGEKWLKFMGDPKAGSPTPFTLEYHFYNSTDPIQGNIIPYNTSLLNCSNPDPFHDNDTCGCADCPATCPPLPSHAPVHDPKIFGVRQNTFITLLVIPVWLVLCILFIMAVCTYNCTKMQKERGYVLVGETDHGETREQAVDWFVRIFCFPFACVDRLGYHVELGIKKMFELWGLFAAKCWFIVIPCGLIVCVVLSVGLTKFQVTTNPVELWSAPSSRARMEKNYFDSHFGPFYRTEQVIITTNMSSVNYSITDTSSGQVITKTIGPVFNKEVLLEVSTHGVGSVGVVGWGGAVWHVCCGKEALC